MYQEQIINGMKRLVLISFSIEFMELGSLSRILNVIGTWSSHWNEYSKVFKQTPWHCFNSGWKWNKNSIFFFYYILLYQMNAWTIFVCVQLKASVCFLHRIRSFYLIQVTKTKRKYTKHCHWNRNETKFMNIFL